MWNKFLSYTTYSNTVKSLRKHVGRQALFPLLRNEDEPRSVIRRACFSRKAKSPRVLSENFQVHRIFFFTKKCSIKKKKKLLAI